MLQTGAHIDHSHIQWHQLAGWVWEEMGADRPTWWEWGFRRQRSPGKAKSKSQCGKLTGAESPGGICQGGWGQRKSFWNVSEKAKLRPQLSQGAGPRANKLQFCLQREKEAWVNETPDFP